MHGSVRKELLVCVAAQGLGFFMVSCLTGQEAYTCHEQIHA